MKHGFRDQALSAADRRSAGRAGSRGLPDDPGELVSLISEIELLKSTGSAVQAEASVAYDAARRAAEAEQGVSARRQGRGVAAEIALARKESPHRGQLLLGFAKTMCAETPHLLARLKDGSLSEFRAMLAVRELNCLTAEDRGVADVELFTSPKALEGLGTRQLIGRVKRLVCELDPAAVVRRRSNAEADRHVSLRPAPDTMAYLTTLVPVGINLVMSDTTLTGSNTPALVESETVPAEVARLLAARALEQGSGLDNWIRQLYTDQTGRLVAMTSKQRNFPTGLAEFLKVKGQGICANPWCDAPIRHIDHITPVEQGGQTTADNGQGTCAACNHAKQAPGWRQQPLDGSDGVETITPTGHRYRSHPPPLPEPALQPDWFSEIERHLRLTVDDLVRIA